MSLGTCQQTSCIAVAQNEEAEKQGAHEIFHDVEELYHDEVLEDLLTHLSCAASKPPRVQLLLQR